MDMATFYEQAEKVPAGFKLCGDCGEVKPVSEFFKDGYDYKGEQRYRRDCKECYKVKRVDEAEYRKRTGKLTRTQQLKKTAPKLQYGLSQSKAALDTGDKPKRGRKKKR